MIAYAPLVEIKNIVATHMPFDAIAKTVGAISDNRIVSRHVS